MSIKQNLERMNEIQRNIYDYLESENNIDEKFADIQFFLNECKIRQNKYDLITFFDFIAKLANNYHHCFLFFDKLINILKMFKNEMQKYFTISEIFNIFAKNKRIILFLVEEKIISFDEYIIKKILSKKYIEANYPEFFSPEIKPFINEKWFLKKNLEKPFIDQISKEFDEDFYAKRKICENDEYICTLIQKDSIKDFVTYITKNSYSLESTINPSIYESNSFLYKKHAKSTKITLIEYAAFFGSIQIFQYLRLNNVQMMPSLWLYAVHGKNAEIIHLLEESKIVEPENQLFTNCYKELIKCHHNDIAYYIKNNYLYKTDFSSSDFLVQALKYHNFEFIEIDSINQSSFCYLCQYNYISLIDLLFKSTSIDVNDKMICK